MRPILSTSHDLSTKSMFVITYLPKRQPSIKYKRYVRLSETSRAFFW
uniref:Uncharacterized protein n=1 Tax=Rhizophora mucronata TaxID=61149 RepID=A0A2P2Q8H3_RHIMU